MSLFDMNTYACQTTFLSCHRHIDGDHATGRQLCILPKHHFGDRIHDGSHLRRHNGGNQAGENTPPACDAGQDLNTDVNEMVYLDASNSADWDGDSLQNPSWQILEKPENSSAMVVNPSNLVAEFTPDVIGNFTLEFYVDDGEDFCKDTIILEAVITTPSITPFTVSQVLTKDAAMTDITFTSEGGHIETWEISPDLPTGLDFDSEHGRRITQHCSLLSR